MRRSLRRWLFGSAAAGVSCAALVGVGACRPYDCNDWVSCEPPPPCEPDPAVAPAEDRCGVFVSSSAGKDEGPGTRAQPVLTMERAIALAQAGPMRVYACAEAFLEPVVVPAGVEVWGGLDCAKDWNYLGGNSKTVIAPAAGTTPLRFEAGGGTSVVADMRAEAADAAVPSGSSIAAMVMQGAAVEILRSELIAGDGAPGANGRDGGSSPAQTGVAGADGGNACSADVVPGGTSVTRDCGGLTSAGGQGGQGTITAPGDGQPGEPAPVPNPGGFGAGGLGQRSAVALCTVGVEGDLGAAGMHGDGGRGAGRLSLAGWEGEAGKDGGNGLPGQGGGGGGASLGGAMLCGNNQARGGAGGGSGGAGGCGGRGGKGGGYGGASIGLLNLGTQVAIRMSTIVTSNGGDGGNGGLRQAGGLGGVGGLGGAGSNAVQPGCHGGEGGRGGNGGNGGGGAGGSSIGIAHVFGLPVTQEGVIIQVGLPGRGGLGGNPGIPGSAGEDGLRSGMLPFPQ